MELTGSVAAMYYTLDSPSVNYLFGTLEEEEPSTPPAQGGTAAPQCCLTAQCKRYKDLIRRLLPALPHRVGTQ